MHVSVCNGYLTIVLVVLSAEFRCEWWGVSGSHRLSCCDTIKGGESVRIGLGAHEIKRNGGPDNHKDRGCHARTTHVHMVLTTRHGSSCELNFQKGKRAATQLCSRRVVVSLYRRSCENSPGLSGSIIVEGEGI